MRGAAQIPQEARSTKHTRTRHPHPPPHSPPPKKVIANLISSSNAQPAPRHTHLCSGACVCYVIRPKRPPNGLRVVGVANTSAGLLIQRRIDYTQIARIDFLLVRPGRAEGGNLRAFNHKRTHTHTSSCCTCPQCALSRIQTRAPTVCGLHLSSTSKCSPYHPINHGTSHRFLRSSPFHCQPASQRLHHECNVQQMCGGRLVHIIYKSRVVRMKCCFAEYLSHERALHTSVPPATLPANA